MEIDDKIEAKYKNDYLNLILKISWLRLKGDEPTNKLLKQAHEVGRLAGISEHELKKSVYNQL
jgi:hypothetical protein